VLEIMLAQNKIVKFR